MSDRSRVNMSRVTGFALVLAGATAFAASASAQSLDCKEFRQAMARNSGDLKADFVRPLVVSRGGTSGLDQYDLVSQSRVDGVLKCQGESFVSFEATIHLPAARPLIDQFAAAQTAALMATLGWPHARARERVRSLAHEAADYLRGSAERGDVEVAGKVEEHLPGGVDMGTIWTATERTFILLQGG